MKQKIKHSVHKIKTAWYIWLFPVFALMLTGWLLFSYFQETGPRLRILFEDAGGIQAEKTTLRYRGVPIGTVRDVKISDDQQDVVVEVLLRRDAQHFAVEGSKFSLVTPKVNFQGVTGLETLLEGPYISVTPGDAQGKKRLEFKAAQTTTSAGELDDTSAFLLETENAESVSQNDSVTYRGLKIGQVTKLYFDKPARTVQVQINIENRYARLIRLNTIFWRKSGIQAKLGLFKSELKINSMDSIMNGGIEISTPEPAGPRAKWMHKFALSAGAPKEAGVWKPQLE